VFGISFLQEKRSSVKIKIRKEGRKEGRKARSLCGGFQERVLPQKTLYIV